MRLFEEGTAGAIPFFILESTIVICVESPLIFILLSRRPGLMYVR